MIAVIIVIAAIVLLVLAVVGAYNGIVRQRNQVDNGWAQIDVQLTRRADLIPNLVETVKGYAAHERGVFEEVTAARAQVQQAAAGGTVEQKVAAEAALDQALVKVNAVAEAYPDLKASANFLDLQAQLQDTENQLAFARQYYNDAVSTQNQLVITIPWMFVAGIAGVGKREFYQAPLGQEGPPTVSFG